MQILTLHAKIRQQTKFKANRAKNDIFGIWAPSEPAPPPWVHPGNHEYSKLSNIDTASYFAS